MVQYPWLNLEGNPQEKTLDQMQFLVSATIACGGLWHPTTRSSLHRRGTGHTGTAVQVMEDDSRRIICTFRRFGNWKVTKASGGRRDEKSARKRRKTGA
jgi:hypothetical protein